MVVIMIFRDEFFVMKVFFYLVFGIFFVYFLYVFNEMLKVLFFFDNFLLDIYFV